MWLTSAVHHPYGSYGNGAAMRVSPVGWAFEDLEITLAEAERTALPTHNHPEGIKGAQVVAEAIYRLRRGEWDKIQELLISSYGVDYVRPIRKPTVPPGRERLRISLTAAMTAEEIDHIGEVVRRWM